MKRTMTAAIIAGTALGVPLAGQAQVAEAVAALVIAVGQPDRGYERRGLEIAQELSVTGITAEVQNNAGTEEIVKDLCDGTAQIGIAQIDGLYAAENANCNLEIVATYGTETAILLLPPDSPLDSLSDFAAGTVVLTDLPGSGTDLFWKTIVRIEREFGRSSEWINARQEFAGMARATALADAGEIDAVVLVGDPQSDQVLDLFEKGWTLGSLYDRDINDRTFRRGSLYEPVEVEIDVPGAWFNVDGDAYAVKSFIVANSEWAASQPDVFNTVSRIAN